VGLGDRSSRAWCVDAMPPLRNEKVAGTSQDRIHLDQALSSHKAEAGAEAKS